MPRFLNAAFNMFLAAAIAPNGHAQHLRRLGGLGWDQVGGQLAGTPNLDDDPNVDTTFGSTVKVSADGERLAIGSPFHDFDTPDASGSTTNFGGGVFLYDLVNDDSWTLHSFIAGDLGEQVGSRIDLSSDGSALAIRRNSTGASYVEVFDVSGSSGSGTPPKLGASLLCDKFGTEEGNGATVSLSSNGSRIAVSCENYQNLRGRVQIYDWNATDNDWGQIGELTSIAAGEFGTATAFGGTNDNRLAVSAYFFRPTERRGLVQVYDYDGSFWTQVGSDLVGIEDREEFGWAMDMSSDGSTLVVGSNQREGSGVNLGAVTSFEFDDALSEWSQKGDVIEGTDDGDRFGFAVCINQDGSRIAASSPFHENGKGEVRVLQWDNVTSEWFSVNGNLKGEVSLERLGFGVESIAMDGSGSQLALGSLWYKNEAGLSVGRVRVFEQDLVPSASPSLAPSVAPTVSSLPTIASSSTPSVSVSPTLVPSAGPSLEPTVVALATSLAPSSAGTATPSSSPSSSSASPSSSFSPSTSQAPSGTPVTLAPTGAPVTSSPTSTATPTSTSAGTAFPTVVLGKFDWYLERVGDAVIAFDEESDTEEIRLSYNISLRETNITIFETDCETPVPSSVVAVNWERTITSPTNGNLAVDLDIKQDTVVTSGIWEDGVTGEGFVKLCVRVDLLLDGTDTSVNFHEQRIDITIGLNQGFRVTAIDLERDAADEEADSASLDYGVSACQCNSLAICESETLSQGDDVYICVYTNATNVKIAGIDLLDFIQNEDTPDEFSVRPISNGTEDALTEVDLRDGKRVSVRSQLVSAFFVNDDPADVIAEGVATLVFEEDSRRRLLHQRPISFIRARALSSEPDDFKVIMSLKTEETGSSGAVSISVWGPLVATTLAALMTW